ncbi:MAG TPA: hypothetical protein V6D19_17465 [Stenomitos sp.]
MEIEPLFNLLREIQFPNLIALQDTPLTSFLPRKSKGLTTNLLKDIFNVSEPMLVVIIGHLYFDYIFQRMLDREPHNLTKRQQESFYAKLEFLNMSGKFDSETYNCLLTINRLRNSFAHNVFYDITHWDPRTIPFVQKYSLRIPKQKKFLRAFDVVLLKLSFLAIFDVLLQQNQWLYLEDIPKH